MGDYGPCPGGRTCPGPPVCPGQLLVGGCGFKLPDHYRVAGYDATCPKCGAIVRGEGENIWQAMRDAIDVAIRHCIAGQTVEL